MTHGEMGAWITGGLGLAGAIWNRFGLHEIKVEVDGLLLKYVKGEKASSYSKGQQDDHIGEARDRENLT